MNLFGAGVGILTLAVIGLGFLWVVKLEYYLGYLWWPYVLAAGVVLVGASVFVKSGWWSVLLAISGASVAWGATELKEQAVRAELGWYASNPRRKPKPPFCTHIERWEAPHL